LAYDFEREILKMFALCPDCKYRWLEIRNHLQMVMKILPQPKYKQSTFNVKLSRNLKNLVKHGFLKRIEEGHMNTSYVLDKKGLERVIETYSADPTIRFTLVGVYEYGDSYEEFKTKAMNRLGKLFDKELQKHYEEAKKYEERITKGALKNVRRESVMH